VYLPDVKVGKFFEKTDVQEVLMNTGWKSSIVVAIVLLLLGAAVLAIALNANATEATANLVNSGASHINSLKQVP